MLTLLFIICMFGVFGKLFFFGLKAAWGISKFVLTIVFLPLILLYTAWVYSVLRGPVTDASVADTPNAY